jgi:peptidyl-dipeptidase Dcp
VFDPKTAQAFEEHILSAGGREHPSILYKRFRGRDPKPNALLRRSGLVSA